MGSGQREYREREGAETLQRVREEREGGKATDGRNRGGNSQATEGGGTREGTEDRK